ncbi:ATP-binding protein [Thalassobaculum sp. OXR-137]|uniref:sensor histidine kinase n=1 Tax=Thalassobaculum sp. OXR-137 TaxID=3100173 RepID=UPI002AC96C1B|nr:ATP-binding protein [Thalassobaculum sp. OXR-137]WPZ32530.1 ATP-binding protein [Thalassobaculum sp. OXR-137]
MQNALIMTDDAGPGRTDRARLLRYAIRRVAVAAVLGLACALLVEFVLADMARRNAENRAREDLNLLRASLQQILSRDVQLIRGMVGYVRARPNMTPEEFDLIAQDILEGAPKHIRNLALAKDLVVSHMYPFAGNEQAVGLDYRRNESQWPEVKKVIDEQRIVVAGPLALVQGGIGLIARFPIFLRADANGSRKLWGIASTVIDFTGLLEHAGYDRFAETYHLALSGRNGELENAEIIWGEPGIRALEPISLDVVIPTGSWRILATPREGWPNFTSYLYITVPVLILLIAAYAALCVARFRRDEELNKASQDVLVALRRAEEASAAKSTFLAVMSHELRTPLNAIIGFSELLENSPRNSRVWDRAVEYVGDIRQSGRFLLSIIDDILDLSRIESGSRPASIEHVDVVPLMLETANRLRVEFENSGVALSVMAEKEEMVALADRRAVIQILANLLNNALKYAGTAANVQVSATLTGDGRLALSVSDDGMGIPSEKLEEIMKPFVQLSSSYARAAGGVGLGLTICQSLARTMNGTLSVESRVNEGTTVRLTLPLSPAA